MDKPIKTDNAAKPQAQAPSARVLRFDRSRIDGVTKTPQGYIKTVATISRVGILIYQRSDGTVSRELVGADELFRPESMATAEMIPICNDHPPVKLLDASTTKTYQVGFTGEAVKKDQDMLSVPVTVIDAMAIRDVDAGKVEISAGYECQMDETPGIWEGQAYDIVQRNRIYNHIAIVAKGRAGGDVKLHLDAADAVQIDAADIKAAATNLKQEDKSMKSITIGDKKYDINDDALVDALGKLLEGKDGECKDAFNKVCDAIMGKAPAVDPEAVKEKEANDAKVKDLKAAVEAGEAKADSLKAELKSLKAAHADSAAAVNEAAKVRVTVLETARKVIKDAAVLAKLDSMTNTDIKKAVILVVEPDAKAKLDAAGEGYVEARFDSVTERLAHVSGADDLGKILNQVRTGEAKADAEGDDVIEKSRLDSMKKQDELYKKPVAK
jgi:hypothetical protein